MEPLIACIVGARPQFIKHKPVIEAFSQKFRTLTIHTCQHFDHDMSRIFFKELGLPEPDFILESTSRDPLHGAQTASMLVAIERLLVDKAPQAVLVYGDTNSTLAGALAASKLRIPIIHVEAGLRSYNRAMPEELNRVVTDHLSTLLFAPTSTAVDNLRAEGLRDGVHMVGDVMCDVLKSLSKDLSPPTGSPYIFATIHRPSNADNPDRIRTILSGLNMAPCKVVLPLHPRTRATVERSNIQMKDYPNIEVSGPVGYLECLALQRYAEKIVTDSGGIQKEAYMLRIPCITLREETEWVETLKNDCNILTGAHLQRLPELLSRATSPEFEQPYGDGTSALAMAEISTRYIESMASQK